MSNDVNNCAGQALWDDSESMWKAQHSTNGAAHVTTGGGYSQEIVPTVDGSSQARVSVPAGEVIMAMAVIEATNDAAAAEALINGHGGNVIHMGAAADAVAFRSETAITRIDVACLIEGAVPEKNQLDEDSLPTVGQLNDGNDATGSYDTYVFNSSDDVTYVELSWHPRDAGQTGGYFVCRGYAE